MDGIFVAFHNTAEIFGFQYISREELDKVLFGSVAAGDMAYSLVLGMYQNILQQIVASEDPGLTVRLTFALNRDCSRLSIFKETFEEYPSGILSVLPGPSSTFQQYSVSTQFSLHGVRVDAFPGCSDHSVLMDRQAAQPKVAMKIAQVSPDRKEFDVIRAKMGGGQVSLDDGNQMIANIMKAIGSSGW